MSADLDRLARVAEFTARERTEALLGSSVTNWPEVVRAVLREMRNNPSREMMLALKRSHIDAPPLDRVQSGWQSAIDEVLK